MTFMDTPDLYTYPDVTDSAEKTLYPFDSVIRLDKSALYSGQPNIRIYAKAKTG